MSAVRETVVVSPDSPHTFLELSPSELAPLTVPFKDISRLPAVLEEHGVAVVPDLLSADECAALKGMFSHDLYATLAEPQCALRAAEAAGPPSATLAAALREVLAAGPGHAAHVWPPGTPVGRRGFASERSLPHGRFAWASRLHAHVRACFASLHGTDDLCVGLDQPMFVPRGVADAAESSSLWPHADQNEHCRQGGADAVFQSVLYVWGSDRDGASTTVVQPRSHRTSYPALMADAAIAAAGAKSTHHFAQVSAMSDAAAAARLWGAFLADGRRVPVPAGGLLIWSSRTLHQGHSGGARLAMPI
jgi:hypothetical protein